jgi:hypothetical protein
LTLASEQTEFLKNPLPQQAEFVVGNPIYVNWAIKNESEIAVTEPFMVGINVDGKNVLDFQVKGLAPREVVFELNVKMDSIDMRVTREPHVSLIVDVDDRVAESDETDNAFAFRGIWNTPTPTPSPTPTSSPSPTPTLPPTPTPTPTFMPTPTFTPTPTPTPFVSRSLTPVPVEPGEVVIVSIVPHGLDDFYAVSVDLGGLTVVGHTADNYQNGVFTMVEADPFTYSVRTPECTPVGQTYVMTSQWWTDVADKRDMNPGQTSLKVGGQPLAPLPLIADLRSANVPCQGMLVTSGPQAGFNTSTNDSWSLTDRDESFIDFTFSLESVPAQAHLMAMHMTTGAGGVKNGGFAPVDIFVNGAMFKENYDVAEAHGDPQQFELDMWDVSTLLTPGINTVRIALDGSAETQYWIQHLALMDLAGAADLRSDPIVASLGLLVANGADALFNSESTQDSWYFTLGEGYLEFSINVAAVSSNSHMAVVHMTTGGQGTTNGGYSPVDISINGNTFKQKYDVSEAHGAPEEFEIDLWPVSDFLAVGANTIRIELNEASETQYWIQYFAISN